MARCDPYRLLHLRQGHIVEQDAIERWREAQGLLQLLHRAHLDLDR